MSFEKAKSAKKQKSDADAVGGGGLVESNVAGGGKANKPAGAC